MSAVILKRLEELERKAAAEIAIFSGATVIGLVSPAGNLVKCIRFDGEKYAEVHGVAPQAFFAEKLEPIFTRPKRFIIVIGGRGSGKSIGIGDIGLINMHDAGLNLMCIREFQSSIADSVHGLLKEEVSRLELSGVEVTERAIGFTHNNTFAKFAGLARNPESVKSAFGFLQWWIEESQFLSDKSLKTLTPTARNRPKKGLPRQQEEVGSEEVDLSQVRMMFCGNPASSEDPFSKRFIVPFKDALDRDGVYEDDMHLVIKMNWSDNPWFEESGLEQERQFDYKHLPRSTYDWIWEGGFNDDIENSLIKAEWFDACVDAHIKLGMKPYGVIKVSHDPADRGADPKAICVRKGNIITSIEDRADIDVNEGCDWSLGIAINENADVYIWDVGGMGTSLRRDVNNALEGKRVEIHQFNGAGAVEDPDMIYEPSGATNARREMTNKEVLSNQRAQRYRRLQDRVYRTYRAVVHNEMCDPDLLVSFDSNCGNLSGLRSELCRMPIKPSSSGRFELYTKEEMRNKFKVRSPNLADCVMMTEFDWSVHVEPDYSNYTVPSSTRW
ncbi:MAG: phage terminase large subunit [Clostridium sp.]|uniref:phage terminase large subunit n=1 Tax=Clostridium sp. TaxID=1506 RepID=UPI003EE7F599